MTTTAMVETNTVVVMTDQETEVVIEGDDQDQDQGQGVLTGIAETLAVGEIDSEGETGLPLPQKEEERGKVCGIDLLLVMRL